MTDEHVESFRRDGYVILEEGFLSAGSIELLRERFAALFDGDYATGAAPDEVNWKKARALVTHMVVPVEAASIPPRPASSSPATAAAATFRSMSLSSRSCGTRPAPAAPG